MATEQLTKRRVTNKQDLAYTAGIIDGEGCISLNKNNSKSCKRGYVFQLCIGVTNTNEWLIQWLHFHYGGFIGHQKQRKFWQKDKWIWQIVAKQAQGFLELILPYLKLKQAQAELALQFQKAKRNTGKAGKTDEEAAIEEAQAILMHKLNKKGKSEGINERISSSKN